MRMVSSLISVILLTSSVYAAGAPARSIDFSLVLNDLVGPAPDCNAVDPKTHQCTATVNLTLGRFAAEALSMPDPKDALATTIRKGALAQKLFSAGKLTLPSDDITLIEECIPKLNYRPVVVTNAMKELDPDKVK